MTPDQFTKWLADMKSAGLARSDAVDFLIHFMCIGSTLHALLKSMIHTRNKGVRHHGKPPHTTANSRSQSMP